ncbi:ROK family protein [Adhaeribacter rhizoryzae]|uniref:ROK family protein n=1 Tax=Adhaeribacter rhizoryzae TaxID=2607907 RepID=A0A5M6D619_9BACT|nr:ROK family protein [Adhaeribacter rhizoryzae]KAA5541259.1 ROK family protein [Adhaeribacter rhizoryzae]
MQLLWGIDLGGTKIEGVVLEPGPSYKVLSRLRVPTEADKGYSHILNQIAALLNMLATETGEQPAQIGIGTPGSLDPATQLLKNSNTTCLNKQPLKKDLEAKLGLPVIISNDANCFALAETLLGVVPEVAPAAEVVVGLILGTGVGSGIVVNNRVLQGRQGIAGEWGHNFLDESGGPCYCGRVGCVETVLSGPALQRYYASLSGEKLTLKEIVARSEAGTDVYAQQTVARLIEFFGRGLAVLVNILDPDAIVIGGGVGNIPLLYTEGVASVKKYVFNLKPDILLLKPKLGDSAGVFGAAMLTA